MEIMNQNTERIFTPWNIVSFGIVGIMYLIYLDFGRGDTIGQKFIERMEHTVLVGYVPCLSSFESFGEDFANEMTIMIGGII